LIVVIVVVVPHRASVSLGGGARFTDNEG
jgi:hypothetical protein